MTMFRMLLHYCPENSAFWVSTALSDHGVFSVKDAGLWSPPTPTMVSLMELSPMSRTSISASGRRIAETPKKGGFTQDEPIFASLHPTVENSDVDVMPSGNLYAGSVHRRDDLLQAAILPTFALINAAPWTLRTGLLALLTRSY